MQMYFDESGDFASASDRFAAYVQAVLICPTSFVDKIEHYVENASYPRARAGCALDGSKSV